MRNPSLLNKLTVAYNGKVENMYTRICGISEDHRRGSSPVPCSTVSFDEKSHVFDGNLPKREQYRVIGIMKVNKTVELAGTHCWLALWRFTINRDTIFLEHALVFLRRRRTESSKSE